VSRLDSHIRQKLAQRDAIDLAARWLGDRPGVIVEVGLGTGRSYSHLRERFPGREIVCFDRRDVCHPRCRPPADCLILGELTQVLRDPRVHARLDRRVMLLHLDLGSGGPEDETLPELVLALAHRWLVDGAIVLSDQDLSLQPEWRLARPDTTDDVQHADRYFVYRHRP
jgi:hypothetical protein